MQTGLIPRGWGSKNPAAWQFIIIGTHLTFVTFPEAQNCYSKFTVGEGEQKLNVPGYTGAESAT